MAAISGTTAALIGLMTIGTAASTMYSARQQRKAAQRAAPAPMPMPAAPTVKDAATQATEALRSKKRAIARSKSIYTSPLGIGGEAQVIRKTLLGQ